AERLPPLFADAAVTVSEVADWVRHLVAGALAGRGVGHPVVRSGPSLLLTGKVGRGKTYQAFGALRALSVSGVHCRWLAVGEADMFATLRPRNGHDTESEFEALAGAGVLLLDDLGAAKRTEWTEEVVCRLINHRNEWRRATLVTTNRGGERDPLSAVVGERVASRLAQMCTPVAVTGPDRRRDRGGW
ncbi:MAG: ATP-binding protein, partial [Gammaproteobacteria bacterium]